MPNIIHLSLVLISVKIRTRYFAKWVNGLDTCTAGQGTSETTVLVPHIGYNAILLYTEAQRIGWLASVDNALSSFLIITLRASKSASVTL